MSDPKDELRARFDEQADPDDQPAASPADTDSTADTTDGTQQTTNTNNSGDANNTSNSNNTDETGATSEATDDTTPGPARDATATRHRRQIPMYLPDEKAESLNNLYERIDARSKIAGDEGIEKHADFMEQLVEFAVDHESELANRLGVESE